MEVDGATFTLYYKINEDFMNAEVILAEQHALGAAAAAAGPLCMTPESAAAAGGSPAAAPTPAADPAVTPAPAGKAAGGRQRASARAQQLPEPVRREMKLRVARTMRRNKHGQYVALKDQGFWHIGFAAVKKALHTWAIQAGHTPVSEAAIHKAAVK